MSEFLSPGVFIEEVDAGPKPIEGVSTSTAGAVGVTRFGPTSGKPVLVTSFAEFVRIFGPPIPEPPEPLLSQWAREKEGGRWWQLALSIKGFFDNGGQRIFVKRVFSKNGAHAAEAEIKQGIFIEIEADAKATDATLKLRHLIGIFRLVDVTVFNPSQVGIFDVVAYDPVTRIIRLDRQLGKAVQAGKSFVKIRFDPSQPVETTLTARAKALGRWGNDLKAQVRPMVGATATLLADPTILASAFNTTAVSSELTWLIEVADRTGLANDQKVTIKGREYTIENVDPELPTFEIKATPPNDLFSPDDAVGETIVGSLTVNAVSAAGVTFVENIDKMLIGDRLQVNGKAFKVVELIAAPNRGVKVSPSLPSAVGSGVKVRWLTPKVELGDSLLVGIGDAEVDGEAAQGADSITLKDATEASSLVIGDRIKVGADTYNIVAKPSPKQLTVEPRLKTKVENHSRIKKFKLLVVAGTRRKMSTALATGLGNGDRFIFLPAQKEFKILATSPTIQFTPAIPLGRDWTSLPIEYKLNTEVKTALTGTELHAAIELNNVTFLQKGDSVVLADGIAHVLTVDPVRAVPGSETDFSGTVTASPGFGAVAEGTPVAKVIRTTVTDNTADWKLTVDSAAGLGNGEHVLIKGEELVVKKNGNVLDFSIRRDAGNPWPEGTLVRRLLAATNLKTPSVVNVSGAAQLYKGAIVELDNGKTKDVAVIVGIDGDKVTLSTDLPDGRYLEGHKLRVVEAEIQTRQVVDNKVVQQESFTNLRLVDDKTTSYLATAVKNGSSLIEVGDPLGPGFPRTEPELADLSNFPSSLGELTSLTKGEDGLERLTIDDFVGEDGGSGKRTGIQALEDIDEVSLCLAPDVWAPTVHQALILHCETLKDRFAILDPQDGLNIEQIRDVKETLDSKYAALYYPWIEVRDSFVGQNVQVAPSGHVAGIYARVDVERGVHKAPANEIIRGITKIADEVTKREQDLLNPRGINALRFFPGRGNRVWGARTISSDSSWKYVNVRRLFLFVEESIDEGTQFVVFEPNAEPTWARVRQTITNFLTTVWRSGALEGTTADQAFFVRCDRSTMSQDDIDNGRLICVIGIAPVKPAEFVVFRIQQKTLDSKT